jgi:hypothetical protein
MTWMHTATSTHPFDDLQVSPTPDLAPLARAAEALLRAVKPLHTLDVPRGTPLLVRVVGKPGSGRTFLARRVARCLRPIDRATLDEINVIRRVARFPELDAPIGEAPKAFPPESDCWVPLRAPHHTVSEIGLFGSGYRPGEVHLAHGGLLVLDEVHEIWPQVQRNLVALMHRQSRFGSAEGTKITPGATIGWAFPARFTMITLETPGSGRNLIAEAFPDAPVIDLDAMRRVAA